MSNRYPASAQWTRRSLLGAVAAAGACGLSLGLGEAQTPSSFDGSSFKLQAPEPNPKHGGVLRYGVLNAPAHFDVHQSGTVSNMGTQGCMYDNLIRRNPLDSGQTIIPDLAHSWEISPDGKTYTFFLRKGVLFSDGAELTSADVKATFDRITKPPEGINIPRSALFTSVDEVTAPDKYTVQFKLAAPRPPAFIMGAISSGWNGIVRKKTLEDNNYNLRKTLDVPGTGPFRSVRRVEQEIWVMQKNPDYWMEGLPYLDGIEFYHGLPFSPELGSAFLAGRTDYARLIDPVTRREADARDDMTATDYYQSVIQAVWLNADREPFNDPRVRRAMHLVFDRPVLVEAVKDVAPMLVGGFIYPFSDVATPTEELTKRVGYQPDTTASIKEARALLEAAGHGGGMKGLDFVVRDVATFKIWSQAVQAMLAQALNIECELRTVVESVWFDDTNNGKFDLSVGAIVSTLIDPSDYFNTWYGPNGPQNYSQWEDPRFTELLAAIDNEVDPVKRQEAITAAEMVMEENPPVLPICWEKINDGWYNYVKGHNPYNYFGLYDVGRFDTFWLDK
jgi:ABC-type transport system substrate-binding protein